jgi:hypothetical protein
VSDAVAAPAQHEQELEAVPAVDCHPRDHQPAGVDEVLRVELALQHLAERLRLGLGDLEPDDLAVRERERHLLVHVVRLDVHPAGVVDAQQDDARFLHHVALVPHLDVDHVRAGEHPDRRVHLHPVDQSFTAQEVPVHQPGGRRTDQCDRGDHGLEIDVPEPGEIHCQSHHPSRS